MSEIPQYTKKDFISSSEVRWCPGCGDYSILSAVQSAVCNIGKKREDIVFVSGIGCSSRFPYYMNTYGMHTIHGRAPAIASGLKVQNPNLSVWVVTGDGDGLSIGGNHMIHLLRRNIDINVIMFNNEIYGLTKGQYSPTTKKGAKTKSSPWGSLDRPFNPSALTLGSGSTFYARTIDTDPKHMQMCFERAAQHKGTSFVEVYQNCVIFADKVHETYTNRVTRDDNTVRLAHGKPLIFGKNMDKGIMLKGVTPQIVTIGENGITEADLMVHNEQDHNEAFILSNMKFPDLPVPIGVFRDVERFVYEDEHEAQFADFSKMKGAGSMQKLLHSGNTWVIE